MLVRKYRRKAAWTLCAVTWLGGAVGGLFALAIYGNTPGAQSTPPGRWPAGTSLRRSPETATLLVFLHPYCPCSGATLEELARLARSAQGLVQVQVVMLGAINPADDLEATGLWRRAARIPAVAMIRDVDGREVRLFAARTSGAAFLYDRSGMLRFHGGLTLARGHAGDNAGVDSVLACLRGEHGRPSTPVYGCPLFDDDPHGQPACDAEGNTCCQ